MELVAIGTVHSSLTERTAAPKQGDEGAPDAALVFDPTVAEASKDLAVGDEILVLTWLDRALRDVLASARATTPSRPPPGVFATRSPDRPNPIGLHRVTILAIDGLRPRPQPGSARRHADPRRQAAPAHSRGTLTRHTGKCRYVRRFRLP